MPSPNPHLSNLSNYEPGRLIEDVARELSLNPSTIVKLASNENPIGPSPRALKAIHQAALQAHRYPDGNGLLLRQAIGKKHGLPAEQVVLGNGSNEIIEFLAHAYLKPGDEIIISQYAFAVYDIVGKLFQAKVIEVPALNYGHDLDSMHRAITDRTRIIFIANPNNPTGTSVPSQTLRHFFERVPPHALAVVDEAYQEFLSEDPGTHRLIEKCPNLVIMRTFSKAHGLAGLRVGYGLATQEVASTLQKVRQPFNANSIAQAAALAALGDREHIRKTVKIVKDGRAFLESEFEKREIQFIQSSANFILLHVGDGKKVFEKLLYESVIVRPMHGYKLPEWIRVTIGTPSQNKKFLKALDKIFPLQSA